jgi:thioredoxin reductase
VKDRNREKLDQAVRHGKVALLLESQVREIRAGAVALERQGRVETRPADFVIVRIGGEAPYPFLERIGVRIVRKEIALAETPAAVG